MERLAPLRILNVPELLCNALMGENAAPAPLRMSVPLFWVKPEPVVSMTMGVAREFATQGIRALSISPGPVKTPFQDAAATSAELNKKFLEDVPMGRFGEPEEIGELVLFMCSDACPFMTADTVFVNGGGGWR